MARRQNRTNAKKFRSPADLRGIRVTVMGLGTKGGGLEVAKYLVRQHAHVKVTDLKTASELQPSLDALRGLPVEFVLGVHRDEDFLDADLIVPNPAVPLNSPYLERAREAGVPIRSDMALFFPFCPAPIAGITGTKGKTTTTTITGQILRVERPDTVIAGNIQRSPLADLEKITPRTPVVLELSSWQLEGLEPYRMSPHWAVVTTILPDHLNRYPSFEAYAASKEIILRYQKKNDVLILPTDDTRAAAYGKRAHGSVEWFGSLDATAKSFQDLCRSAQDARPDGLFRDGPRVVRWRQGREEVLLSWDELSGRGEHTRRNMLAGAALSLAMGASLEAVRSVLRSFPGVPHRLETVRVVAGRTFVNDTAATTPDAAIAAIRAFPEYRLVLITGGTDKELDYGPLVDSLTDRIAHVVLLDGSATKKLRARLVHTRFKSARVVRTMTDAVTEAVSRSLPGDVILMSPGAASFELFRDEFDRGEQFRAAAAALPENLSHQ